jgi:hypothetical protein
MTAAVGTHAHETRKLGLQPPTHRAALALGDYLTGVAPAHPVTADHFGTVPFGMYANDQHGVCGPTAAANLRRLVTAGLTGAMVAPSQEDVYDLYRRSGNPNFDPNLPADDPRQQDDGVEMQTMLEAVQASGIGGVRSVAFAKVDVTSDDEMTAAVSLFGGILWGVDLDVAQQAQTDAHPPFWDYKRSAVWGGHAVLTGAYETGNLEDVISWDLRIPTTAAFRRRQLGEAWVVIFPEHLGSRAFQAGVNLAGLAAGYQALTGRPLPAVVPPQPLPPPAPTPTPMPPAPTPVPARRPADSALIAAFETWRASVS